MVFGVDDGAAQCFDHVSHMRQNWINMLWETCVDFESVYFLSKQTKLYQA